VVESSASCGTTVATATQVCDNRGRENILPASAVQVRRQITSGLWGVRSASDYPQ
jgi:hypothetical protein